MVNSPPELGALRSGPFPISDGAPPTYGMPPDRYGARGTGLFCNQTRTSNTDNRPRHPKTVPRNVQRRFQTSVHFSPLESVVLPRSGSRLSLPEAPKVELRCLQVGSGMLLHWLKSKDFVKWRIGILPALSG